MLPFLKIMSITALINSESKKTFRLFLLAIATATSSLLSFVILARALNVSEYGFYVYILSIIGLAGVLASFGLPTLITREIARFSQRGDASEIRRILLFSFFVLTLGAVAAGIVIFILLSRTFSIGVIKAPLGLIFIAVLLLFLTQANVLMVSVINGLSESFRAAVPSLFGSLVFLFIIVTLWFNKIHISTAIVLSIQACTAVLTLLIQIVQIQYLVPYAHGNSQSNTPWLTWLVEAFPLLGVGIAFTINSQVDMVLLGMLKGSSYAAIYQVGTKAASVLVIALGSLAVVYQPLLSRAHFEGDLEEVKRKSASISRIAFSVAIIGAILFIPLRDAIIGSIFGPAYIDAGQVMMILIFARLVNSSVGAVGPYLSMTQKSKQLFAGLAVESIMNVTLNLLLIPGYGYTGAAVATGSSMVLMNIYMAFYIKKKYGVSMFIF
jgi:O-antigen/teichoic acid export membrane protein